jgi:hypothetical protein
VLQQHLVDEIVGPAGVGRAKVPDNDARVLGLLQVLVPEMKGDVVGKEDAVGPEGIQYLLFNCLKFAQRHVVGKEDAVGPGESGLISC